ncbi:MAG TPA: hypothetical protein VLE21_05635 [Candidatus Nitrosocosmicus sp.]|nr:hypothetical protein [Candidatus Nitrosocosmicus sp.]
MMSFTITTMTNDISFVFICQSSALGISPGHTDFGPGLNFLG